MQLVQPVNLLPPSICIICETQPDGEAVVDTLYNFKPGVASVLNGRKYVCERCVGEFARLFGYETGQQVQVAQWEADISKREVATIRQRIDEFAKALADVVNHPGITQETVDYAAVFTPPALDNVRAEARTRFEGITSDIGSVPKPAKRQKVERPAVPAPGLTVTEEAAVETVPEATVNAAKEPDGSAGQKE